MGEDLKIDIEKMSDDALLKFIEIEWKDHFQTREQTWKALQVSCLIAVAVVGAQWDSDNALIRIITSLLLMAVAWFGMQITIRHRNSVEVKKFFIICLMEEKLKFHVQGGLPLPGKITYFDIIKKPLSWEKQNTSVFLLRAQCIILSIGFILLLYGLALFVIG